MKVVALSVLCVLSLAVCCMSAAFAMTPQEKQAFVKQVKDGCTQQLGSSASVSSQKVSDYCACSAKQTADTIQNWPMKDLITPDKRPTPQYMGALQQSAQKCQILLMDTGAAALQ